MCTFSVSAGWLVGSSASCDDGPSTELVQCPHFHASRLASGASWEFSGGCCLGSLASLPQRFCMCWVDFPPSVFPGLYGRERPKSECSRGRKQALPVPWHLASEVQGDAPFCWSEQFRGQLRFRGRARNVHLLKGNCHPHIGGELCWRASLRTGCLSVPSGCNCPYTSRKLQELTPSQDPPVVTLYDTTWNLVSHHLYWVRVWTAPHGRSQWHSCLSAVPAMARPVS